MSTSAFDFIIVGGGSAGSVLAARLSEDPSSSVLLVEAGPDLVPATCPAELRSPNAFRITSEQVAGRYTWTSLQARRTPRQARSTYWRGRGLGGSSAINGQIAVQALPEDYDDWQRGGCRGWAYSELLEDVRRVETDLDFGALPYHGDSGPVPISRLPAQQWGAVDLALRDAALALGYPWSEDHNDPASTGVSGLATHSKHGRRISASDAYLEPVRDRPNLSIKCDALVDRVIFTDRRACGVLTVDGELIAVHEDGEIILCAGAVGSPSIMLRSGIGPVSVIKELGLKPIVSLPVGENVAEHPIAGIVLTLRPGSFVKDIDDRHINCCIRYTSGLTDSGRNDMMIFSLNLTGINSAARTRGFIGASVYQAFSRGKLTIQTLDPTVQPEIDLMLASDSRDLIRLRDGIRRVVELVAQPSMRAIASDARPMESSVGFADVSPSTELTLASLESESVVDDWLLSCAGDAQHIVGTCRMGSEGDPASVVDPDCRVLGMHSLRVIDASIMPTVPRANTHLPTLAIAEHMARRLRH